MRVDPIVMKFGSHLYGKTNPLSDKDMYIITDEIYEPYLVLTSGGVDAHYATFAHFQEMLEKHDIAAMELYSAYNSFMENNFKFEVDPEKLRRSISAVVSNSWVKAKKKMAQGDDYIGRKSMWHSIRILMFGIQIAKFGKVVDLTEANEFYDDIVLSTKSHQRLVDTYKPLMNQKQSEFRVLIPKTW